MLEGQNWSDCCALLWMKDNQSPATERYRRGLQDCLEKNKKFVALTKVQIGHFIDVAERRQPAELSFTSVTSQLHIVFLWEDRDISCPSAISN